VQDNLKDMGRGKKFQKHVPLVKHLGFVL